MQNYETYILKTICVCLMAFLFSVNRSKINDFPSSGCEYLKFWAISIGHMIVITTALHDHIFNKIGPTVFCSKIFVFTHKSHSVTQTTVSQERAVKNRKN